MKVSILCSSAEHPINSFLDKWIRRNSEVHDIELHRSVSECSGGDVLFLISCHEIVRKKTRAMYRYCVVIHASDLPKGRGWSPHIWDIINGNKCITVSLLNAEDSVDSGKIWRKSKIDLIGNEIYSEINDKLFDAEMEHMDWFMMNCDAVEPAEQFGEASVYPRRNPNDSRLDPAKSISDQFDLLRVCDPVRFPAFFEYRGARFMLHIKKDESL